MTEVNIHEAKTHLSQLIKRALMGERIIIAKGNKPLVELVVLPEVRQQRRLGGAKEAILSMEDDFDEPLAEFQEYMP
jgi:prevent-host-death family protein